MPHTEKGAPAPTEHPFKSPNHSSLDNCENTRNDGAAQGLFSAHGGVA